MLEDAETNYCHLSVVTFLNNNWQGSANVITVTSSESAQ
jgi:hypothetical protein